METELRRKNEGKKEKKEKELERRKERKAKKATMCDKTNMAATEH